MSEEMNLLILVEDVLLQMLSFCGISGVLAASQVRLDRRGSDNNLQRVHQTCKHLHTLAFDKQVWLALMEDLEARSFLDRPPEQHFRELAAAELINLAKHIVRGPQSWSPLRRSPAVVRQYALHPVIPHSGGILRWKNQAKLLPGGRYVLFQSWCSFECWNVVEDRLVWKHQSQHQNFLWLTSSAAEVVNDGQAATIMLCQRVDDRLSAKRQKCVYFAQPSMVTSHGFGDSVVEIVYLDFLTGISQLLVCTRIPDSRLDYPFIFPNICGNVAVVGLHSMTTPDQILVINWKTESCVVILTSGVRLPNTFSFNPQRFVCRFCSALPLSMGSLLR